jgi:hypothetical protein
VMDFGRGWVLHDLERVHHDVRKCGLLRCGQNAVWSGVFTASALDHSNSSSGDLRLSGDTEFLESG